jgi:hypothetical protein
MKVTKSPPGTAGIALVCLALAHGCQEKETPPEPARTSSNASAFKYVQEKSMRDGMGAPWEHPTKYSAPKDDPCWEGSWVACLAPKTSTHEPHWRKVMTLRRAYLDAVAQEADLRSRSKAFSAYSKAVVVYREGLLASPCAKDLDACRAKRGLPRFVDNSLPKPEEVAAVEGLPDEKSDLPSPSPSPSPSPEISPDATATPVGSASPEPTPAL